MRTTKKDSDKNRYQEIKEKKDQELEMLVKEHESELILDEDVEVDDESDLTGRLESKNITILPDGTYTGFIEKNHKGQINVCHGNKIYYFDFGFDEYIFPSKCIYTIVVKKKRGYLSHRSHVFIRLTIGDIIEAKEKEIKSLETIIKHLESKKMKTPKEILDLVIKNHNYQINKLLDELKPLKLMFKNLVKENDKLKSDCKSRIEELKNSLKDLEELSKEKKYTYDKEYIKFYGKKKGAKIDTINEPTELRFARKLLRDSESLLKSCQGTIHRLDSIYKTLKL